MAPIDFLTVGHITRDRMPDGVRIGGTVAYAAVTARRLGWHPAVVSCCSPQELLSAGPGPGLWVGSPGSPMAGIPVACAESSESTTFVNNVHRDEQRFQVIESRAGPVPTEALPDEWRSPAVVLLGPVAAEVPPEWAGLFPDALMGVTPQGWMREWGADGVVKPARWSSAQPVLQRADAVILSRADVAEDDAVIAQLGSAARLMIVTDGCRGVTLYVAGRRHVAPARPAVQVDPTGAGDVFAAAFLIRLAEASDPLLAVRFASVAASMSVEGPGLGAIPWREQVERWIEQHHAQ